MAEILGKHRKTEPWLRDYILDVIKDLEEEPAAGRSAHRERKGGKTSRESE